MMTTLTGTSTHRITKLRIRSFLIRSGRYVHAAKRSSVMKSQVKGLLKKVFTYLFSSKTRINASTTTELNCVPEFFWSSSMATFLLNAFRYGLSVVMAS